MTDDARQDFINALALLFVAAVFVFVAVIQ